jgi:hypothetical protein
MFTDELDGEDSLDCFESDEHAQLEVDLFQAPSPADVQGVLARARDAHKVGRISKRALAQLLHAAEAGAGSWSRPFR